MESVARGTCTSCSTPIVYLIWRDGKRTLVVQCDCGDTNTFDLELMCEALGSFDPHMVMLENFHPTGKPS